MAGMKIIVTIISVLALAGIADAGYALNQHYAPPLESSCDINTTVSCTAVNQSDYSVLLGIPVAAIGMAGYILIGAGALTALLKPAWRRWLMLAIATAGVLALAFSLWLTCVELFVIKAVCPLCVTSLALVTATTVTAAAGLSRTRQASGRT